MNGGELNIGWILEGWHKGDGAVGILQILRKNIRMKGRCWLKGVEATEDNHRMPEAEICLEGSGRCNMLKKYFFLQPGSTADGR